MSRNRNTERRNTHGPVVQPPVDTNSDNGSDNGVDVEAMQEQIAELEATRNQLQSNIQGLSARRDALLANVSTLQQQVDELGQVLDIRNTALQSTDEAHADLLIQRDQTVQVIQAHETKIQAHETKIEALKGVISRYEIEAAAARAAQVQLPTLKAEVEELQSRLQGLSNAYDDVVAETESAKTVKARHERNAEAFAALSAKAQAQYQELQTRAATLEEQVALLEDKKSALDVSVDEEASENTSDASSADAAEEENNESNSEQPAPQPAPVAEEKKEDAKTTEEPKKEEAKKEEEKKSLSKKMYGFMIAFFAHPVTKGALVLTFTAGLLALGVTVFAIMNIAVIAAVATVGLFAAGYVTHRAYAARKAEAAKTAEAKPAEEKAADAPKADAAKLTEAANAEEVEPVEDTDTDTEVAAFRM